MATIAYIDHPFHRQTQSNSFLPALLKARGHKVDIIYHDENQASGWDCWNRAAGHDAVVMFQHYPDIGPRRFASVHPNVTYVPMLDQFGQWSRERRDLGLFWEPFRGGKILNFSRTLNDITLAAGLHSRCFVYYPEPRTDVVPKTQDGLRGFFWLRRDNQLPWRVVKQLLGSTSFDSFHLHVATDPGFPEPVLPDADDVRRFNITISGWLPDKSQFQMLLAGANVYFAPRLEEGIGLSFLEAMSMGQCVVAPDRPTMNEYIRNGSNGLLYDPQDPQPLDFSCAHQMGREAQNDISSGFAAWTSSQDALVDFIVEPNLPERHDDSPRASSARLATWFINSKLRLFGRKLLRPSAQKQK